jgi:hypothetical protein
MLYLQRLEDDGRSSLELRRDTLDAGRPREGLGRPRDVLGVVGEDDLLVLFDDAEGRPAEPSFGYATLDLRDREQVVKAPLLVARDEEGFRLPVLVEEPLSLDGLDAAS